MIMIGEQGKVPGNVQEIVIGIAVDRLEEAGVPFDKAQFVLAGAREYKDARDEKRAFDDNMVILNYLGRLIISRQMSKAEMVDRIRQMFPEYIG